VLRGAGSLDSSDVYVYLTTKRYFVPEEGNKLINKNDSLAKFDFKYV